ncbi:MAG: hypothetical protein RIS37_268, partial [Actinomycetota bacterium]
DEVVQELEKNAFVQVSASSDGSYLVRASDWDQLSEALGECGSKKGIKLKVQIDPARV